MHEALATVPAAYSNLADAKDIYAVHGYLFILCINISTI